MALSLSPKQMWPVSRPRHFRLAAGLQFTTVSPTLSPLSGFVIIPAESALGPDILEVQGGIATTNTRIGIGHDTHRLAAGGPLRLGGIDIPHDCHLVGHSDADVLLHAVTDALLGAAALGDIGELFPDTDEVHRDRDSAEMLRVACERVVQTGHKIVNLDCIVFAQRPRLGSHKEAMRRRIAEILGVGPGQVGVKAKTGEGVGPVGEHQVVMAQCVVLLEHATS